MLYILLKSTQISHFRFFGLSVIDDRRVDHQLTEEEIIFCDQAEKLIYTDMKQLMPTSSDGTETSYYYIKIAHLPYWQVQIVQVLQTHAMLHKTNRKIHIIMLLREISEERRI